MSEDRDSVAIKPGTGTSDIRRISIDFPEKLEPPFEPYLTVRGRNLSMSLPMSTVTWSIREKGEATAVGAYEVNVRSKVQTGPNDDSVFLRFDVSREAAPSIKALLIRYDKPALIPVK